MWYDDLPNYYPITSQLLLHHQPTTPPPILLVVNMSSSSQLSRHTPIPGWIATPQPSSRIAASIEQSSSQSTTTTASRTTPKTPAPGSGGARGKQLTRLDEVLLIRIAIDIGSSQYGVGKNWQTSFWMQVAARYEAERHQPYSFTSCKTKMRQIEATRRYQLAEIRSGDEPVEDDWTQAADNWLKIVDAYNDKVDRDTQTADQAAEQTRRQHALRDNLSRRLGQKSTYSRVVIDDVDEDEDEDAEGEPDDTASSASPARPARPTRPASETSAAKSSAAETSRSRARDRTRPSRVKRPRLDPAIAEERSSRMDEAIIRALDRKDDSAARIERMEDELRQILDIVRRLEPRGVAAPISTSQQLVQSQNNASSSTQSTLDDLSGFEGFTIGTVEAFEVPE